MGSFYEASFQKPSVLSHQFVVVVVGIMKFLFLIIEIHRIRVQWGMDTICFPLEIGNWSSEVKISIPYFLTTKSSFCVYLQQSLWVQDDC